MKAPEAREDKLPPMTLQEAADHMVRTNPLYELDSAEIRGEKLPVFRNAPRTLRALQDFGAAARAPGTDFLVFERERLTYEEWVAETDRLAAALAAQGVKPGDRVAIAMRNYPEYLTLMMAIATIGAVGVLINAWWTSAELEYGIDDSGVKLIVADGPRAERIRPFIAAKGITVVVTRDPAAEGEMSFEEFRASGAGAPPRPEISTDSEALILYSSGSTGFPKGVVLSHRGATQAVWSWFMTLKALDLLVENPPPPKPQAQLLATPLFHVTATHPIFLLSIALPAKVVMMRKWDADEAVRLIETENVTRFLGVPTMTADLTETAKRLGRTMPSLNNLSSGGAKRPGAQVGQQAEAFPHAAVASGWGLTETNALGTGIAGPEYIERPESAGRLYPGIQQIRVFDEQDREVPVGAIGELCLKSASLMKGYLNNPEATADAIRDGWFHTGDLGSVDEEGYVSILDRKKTIIIRGGENISCLEVEGALHRHPSVVEAAVFPIPDERLGETVGAALYVNAKVTEEELSRSLADLLASFKHPEKYWLLKQPLLRGATDKIDRRAIRTACLSGGGA